MLLKLTGTALVIGGLGFYGISKAGSSARRVNQLISLRLSLNFLDKEITCTHTTLPHALARTAGFTEWPVSCLYRETTANLNRKNMTAAEAWACGTDKLMKSSDLNDSDVELLQSAGPQLGMSDTMEQHKFLTLIQEEIAVQIEKARQEADTARRIWTYAGFIAGAMIVLLLV